MKLEDYKAWLLQHGEIKEEYERPCGVEPLTLAAVVEKKQIKIMRKRKMNSSLIPPLAI